MIYILVGDQLLAWGGSDVQKTAEGNPIVNDLSMKKWATNFTVPLSLQPQKPPVGTTTGIVQPSGGNGSDRAGSETYSGQYLHLFSRPFFLSLVQATQGCMNFFS